MNDSEIRELAEAIENTNLLFKTRTRANDWARNIEEGSKQLKTKQQWGRYYKWLSNPTHFDINEKVDYMDCDEYNPPPYEDCMEVETYKNGPDIFITVKNKNLYPSNQDDEKVEE